MFVPGRYDQKKNCATRQAADLLLPFFPKSAPFLKGFLQKCDKLNNLVDVDHDVTP